MRHLRSILYALVLAPAIWILAGVGFTHDLSSRGRELFAVESALGLTLLLLAGVAYAILVFAPVSPAGPVLAGAAFLGGALWAWNDPQGYGSVWPPAVAKDGFDLSRPGYGLAALLAVPLLCTVLSGRRWAAYEPPVLPIIGPIGRARGSARVAGTPVASEETTVFAAGTGFGSAEATQVVRAADATVIVPPVAVAPQVPVGAQPPVPGAPRMPVAVPAAVSALSSDETTVVSRPVAQVTTGPVDADPTTVLKAADPTTVLKAAEPTTLLKAAEPDTDPVSAETAAGLKPTEPTTDLSDAAPGAESAAAPAAEPAGVDRPVADETPAADEPAAAKTAAGEPETGIADEARSPRVPAPRRPSSEES